MNNFLVNSKFNGKLLVRCAVLCVCSLMLLSLSGCYLLPAEEPVLAPPITEAAKVTYETMEVGKGNIERKITASGTFASAYQENLSFKYKGGTLLGMYTKLGAKVKKGDLIAELVTDNMVSQIKQQEIAVRLNEIAYEQVKLKPDTPALDLERAELNVKSAKIRLDDLKKQYEKSRLYSTISGYVVYVNQVNPGENIAANTTLITVADPTKLYLLYKGDNSPDFKPGIQVDVRYKGGEYKGEVVANPSNQPLDDKNKNSVYVKVNGIPNDVQIGDYGDMVLMLEKKEDVIKLPKNLVFSTGGGNYVRVLENGVKYERDVELGLQDASEVEIKKGLKVGDQVIKN